MQNPVSNVSDSGPFYSDENGQNSSYNQGLTPLHPPHKTLLRLSMIFWLVPLVIAAFIAGWFLQDELDISAAVIAGPVSIFALLMLILLPGRIYRRWGYDMGPDNRGEQLRILRGFLWRTDTIVPFNRIQHIDVAQGPLQRAFDLSTLIVHTAGTHNSIVTLPGLQTSDAETMRDIIKAHIRQDMI